MQVRHRGSAALENRGEFVQQIPGNVRHQFHPDDVIRRAAEAGDHRKLGFFRRIDEQEHEVGPVYIIEDAHEQRQSLQQREGFDGRFRGRVEIMHEQEVNRCQNQQQMGSVELIIPVITAVVPNDRCEQTDDAAEHAGEQHERINRLVLGVDEHQRQEHADRTELKRQQDRIPPVERVTQRIMAEIERSEHAAGNHAKPPFERLVVPEHVLIAIEQVHQSDQHHKRQRIFPDGQVDEVLGPVGTLVGKKSTHVITPYTHCTKNNGNNEKIINKNPRLLEITHCRTSVLLTVVASYVDH